MKGDLWERKPRGQLLESTAFSKNRPQASSGRALSSHRAVSLGLELEGRSSLSSGDHDEWVGWAYPCTEEKEDPVCLAPTSPAGKAAWIPANSAL